MGAASKPVDAVQKEQIKLMGKGRKRSLASGIIVIRKPRQLGKYARTIHNNKQTVEKFSEPFSFQVLEATVRYCKLEVQKLLRDGQDLVPIEAPTRKRGRRRVDLL